jgi:hypothetical protein
MRIDTIRVEDSTTSLGLFIFVTLATVFIATVCLPQFYSEPRTIEISTFPIQITSSVFSPANHFVLLSAYFPRQTHELPATIPVSLAFSLFEMAVGGTVSSF